MASSNSWKLRALMKKNLLILKRNIISTLFEILFPIVLILLAYAIRKAFKLETFEFDKEEQSIENYIQNKSVTNFDVTPSEIDAQNPFVWNGLSILPALKICTILNNKHEARSIAIYLILPLMIKKIY